MQPSFWLKVKKNYIFDNFDNLFVYLKNYSYDFHADNPDYDDTIACMEELCADIQQSLLEQDFCRQYEPPFPLNNCVRLLAATILGKKKQGKKVSSLMLTLISLITRVKAKENFYHLDTLYKFAVKCIAGYGITQIGFNWTDIEPERFTLPLFLFQLVKTGMTTPKNSSPNYVFENKGVLVIDSALKVSLAPMNLAAYNKNGLVSQFSLPLLLEVKVKQREYEKLSDFHRLYLCIANLLASQDTIKSSAVKSKKSYYPDDTFPAVIVNKDRMRIEARSLDPDYKEIRGNVRHHNPANPFEIKDIHQYLKEGDIIMAKMAKDSEFAMDICEDIATYYSDYASADAGHVVPAVFLSKGTNGDHWISDAGVKIYINGMHLDYLSDDILQQYEDAINSGVPIRLKVKDETPDSNTNNSQVFAWVDTDNGPIFSDADPFTPEMAIRNFVNEYLHECREEAEKVLARSQSANVQPISRTEADTLASVLWRMVESGIPAPKERLKFTGALEMLCKMLSREQDCKMLNYERHFLDTLVDFAASGGAKRPEAKRLPTDPDLTAGHEHLLEIIRTYKSEPDRKITPGESEQSAVCANEVENLIKASNALRNIMDDREIHKIFLAILRKLDVEDEYVPDAEGKTYYGSESINLEFKTSSVFPPANRRRYMSLVSDFNIQKWAILKTVCGFLNSRSGGDLLIGVNDSGYAVGLADDIKELFRLNQIPAETADAYRLFLKHLFDHSFKVAGSRTEQREITFGHVDVDIEENAEGESILRVKVRPYQGGIVSFLAPAKERAEEIADAYVRLSGNTVAVTKALEKELLKYKTPSHKK